MNSGKTKSRAEKTKTRERRGQAAAAAAEITEEARSTQQLPEKTKEEQWQAQLPRRKSARTRVFIFKVFIFAKLLICPPT